MVGDWSDHGGSVLFLFSFFLVCRDVSKFKTPKQL